MIQYIDILHAVLIAWLWCSFTPLTILLENITSEFIPLQIVLDHLQCFKCIGFWIGLFMTGNFYFAIISSICTLLLSKLTRTI